MHRLEQAARAAEGEIQDLIQNLQQDVSQYEREVNNFISTNGTTGKTRFAAAMRQSISNLGAS